MLKNPSFGESLMVHLESPCAGNSGTRVDCFPIYRRRRGCRRRKMIECIFGWGKQHGTMRKTKHRGIACAATAFLLNLIAYNLIRIPKLITT